MSEITIEKRKEKCENCTNQQCSKKQNNDNPGSQEKMEMNGEMGKPLNAQPVLLSACLSCDRCVSDEESQRISQQNLKEINRVLSLNKKCDASKHKVVVVSVSPQSLPFFGVKFHLDVAQAAQKLCGFLKSAGKRGMWKLTGATGTGGK
ncbi:nuclear prelamin A recognition factor isoform X1 [Arapaima gigas]